MGEMTREEVLNMPAGREMDAFIAEYVMGIEILRTPNSAICNGCRVNMGTWAVVEKNYHEWGDKVEDVHLYSTDISASMDVLDKFGYWVIKKLGKDFNVYIENNDNVRSGLSEGTDLSLAICQSALLAVMEIEK